MSAAGDARRAGGGPGSGAGASADGDAGAVRRRQLLLFSVIAAVLLVAVAAWLGMGGGKAPAPRSGIEAEIAGPDMPEKVWTVKRLSILTPDRRAKLTPLSGTAEVVPVANRGDPRGFV